MPKQKILVVDDEISVSMEMQEMLTENGYDVPGVAKSGEEAILMARRLKPDLILMDIKLASEMDGIETAKRIRSRMNIPSVFVTGHGKRELLDRAVEADPLGYIMKPLNEAQILAAVRIALGQLDREKRQEDTMKPRDLPLEFISFTSQELRVAEMIRDGRSTTEIAEELGLSVETINWHRKKIRRKLGINNHWRDLMVALRYIDQTH